MLLSREHRFGASAQDHLPASLKQDRDSRWHGEETEADNVVQQKLQGDRWRSPVVSAPVQVQSGQMRQKIVLNLELADQAVKLGHFGIMVDFFFLALAKKV